MEIFSSSIMILSNVFVQDLEDTMKDCLTRINLNIFQYLNQHLYGQLCTRLVFEMTDAVVIDN